MNKITNEQREAIVRQALAKRDAILGGTSADDTEQVIESAMHAVWDWGVSCGVDGISSMHETGDSYNEWLRDKARAKVDEIYALIFSINGPSPVAAQQEGAVGRVDGDGHVTWFEPIPEDGAFLYARPGAAAAAPSPVVEPAPTHSAMEAAARWVEARRDAYVDEHGHSDPDTGAVEFPGDGAEYVFELDEIAEGLRALAPLPEPQVDDLAHTVRRLAHALRKAAPDNDLPAKALDYLKRHGLQGSPLRGAVVEPGAQAGRVAELLAEIDRLNAIINTPHADDFIKAVSIEAEHQRQRWGAEGDAGKTSADWFWLVGYLAGKALHSHAAANVEKAEHHIITTAAACANWHRGVFGRTNMRPGHEDGIDAARATQGERNAD